MTYTFTLQNTPFAQDATFDRLYADSLDDFDSGTVSFRTGLSDSDKKTRIYTLLNQGGYDNEKLISISKDGTTCMYIQGWIKNNTLVWNSAIVGKINNSKSWCSTQQFHQQNKEWIESQGCNAWEVHSIPGSRIETFFKAVNNSGNMFGTFSETTDNGILKMRWEF
jgi:hypothetical protein